MIERVHVDLATPVGQIARFHPAAIAVFEAFDVDYACKGGRSLRDAALATGAEPDAVLDAIFDSAINAAASEGTVSELIHRIVTQHHRFESDQLRSILARMGPSEDGELIRIRRIFSDVVASMSAHMLREERMLFPRIEELDLHPHRVRTGSITRPLLAEFIEHDFIHERLAKLRELALRMRLRGGAYVDLLDELDALSRGIHRHLHLENNVLIPRVIDLENNLKSTRRQASLS